MRKKFTESRTYEQAYAIGEQRIKDAVSIFDKYISKGTFLGGGKINIL